MLTTIEMRMQGEKSANPHLSPIAKKMLSLYLAATLFEKKVLADKAENWLNKHYPTWFADSSFINPVTNEALEQTMVYIRFFLRRTGK